MGVAVCTGSRTVFQLEWSVLATVRDRPSACWYRVLNHFDFAGWRNLGWSPLVDGCALS